jgi:hypothetical protein
MLLSARQEICERYFYVTAVQTGSMDNPTLYSLGSGFFPSPPATATVKNDFMAWTAFPLYLYFTFVPKESVELHKPTGAAPRAAMLLSFLLHKQKPRI